MIVKKKELHTVATSTGRYCHHLPLQIRHLSGAAIYSSIAQALHSRNISVVLFRISVHGFDFVTR